MPSTCRVSRHARFAPILMLMAISLLSGCFRYTQSLTIHPDDTVSGIIVMTARAPDAASASQSPTPPAGAVLPEPDSDSPNIVVAAFEHEEESGYKVTFNRASFEEVAAFAPLSSDGGALLITRYGAELQIMMTVDLTYDLPDEGRDYISTHAETTVSLHVPGRVADTNGEVAGDTITWTLEPFAVNTITATVRSPAGARVAPDGTRSVDPVRAGLLGGTAVLVLALGWLMLRRNPRLVPASGGAHRAGRRKPRAVASVAHQPTASSDKPDPVVRWGEPASRVRPVHQIDGGGWPPPRPPWKEHR